jgi:hypothetical protein
MRRGSCHPSALPGVDEFQCPVDISSASPDWRIQPALIIERNSPFKSVPHPPVAMSPMPTSFLVPVWPALDALPSPKRAALRRPVRRRNLHVTRAYNPTKSQNERIKWRMLSSHLIPDLTGTLSSDDGFIPLHAAPAPTHTRACFSPPVVRDLGRLLRLLFPCSCRAHLWTGTEETALGVLRLTPAGRRRNRADHRMAAHGRGDSSWGRWCTSAALVPKAAPLGRACWVSFDSGECGLHRGAIPQEKEWKWN